MKTWTLAEVRQKLYDDLNLHDEDFITQDEFTALVNEAIDDAEALIHTLYEYYYLTSAPIPLVKGQSLLDLPTDIYGNKIRAFMYDNGSQRYEIKFIKRLKILSEIVSTDDYGFIITNSTGVGYKMKLYPNSRETSSSNATLWYLRNAARVALETDEIDIPEFINFIFQHVRCGCRAKENMGTIPPDESNKLMIIKDLMVSTLASMKDDENEQMDMDLSFYNDFDNNGWGNI